MRPRGKRLRRPSFPRGSQSGHVAGVLFPDGYRVELEARR